MRKASILLSLLSAIAVTSCVPIFYQVYNVKPDNQLENIDKTLVYEDSSCKVTYNLWTENGNIGFIFYNKTEKDIYLNLDKSFFIKNGVAYPYFQNRTISSTKRIGSSQIVGGATSISVTGMNYFDLIQTNKMNTTNALRHSITSENTVSYMDEKHLCIPSKASRIIVEYSINNELIRDCNLYKYPTKKQINSVYYSEETSPLKFYNRIVYNLDNSMESIVLENHFFISEIKNYPERMMIDKTYEEYCGEKSSTPTLYTKHYAPYKFYIKYSKNNDTWEH